MQSWKFRDFPYAAKEPEAGPSSSISASVSVEPSAPTSEDDPAAPVPVNNVPVVQGRIIIQNDSSSDSGNDSEPEVEANVAERPEVRPPVGPPSFAANLSMDNDQERSR